MDKIPVLAMVLALVGGLVRILIKGEARSLFQVAGMLLSTVFVGALAWLIIQEFHIPEGMKYAFVGGAGYSSGNILPIIERFIIDTAEKKGADIHELPEFRPVDSGRRRVRRRHPLAPRNSAPREGNE